MNITRLHWQAGVFIVKTAVLCDNKVTKVLISNVP